MVYVAQTFTAAVPAVHWHTKLQSPDACFMSGLHFPVVRSCGSPGLDVGLQRLVRGANDPGAHPIEWARVMLCPMAPRTILQHFTFAYYYTLQYLTLFILWKTYRARRRPWFLVLVLNLEFNYAYGNLSDLCTL